MMPRKTYYISLNSFNGSDLIGDNEYITIELNEPYWWEKLLRKPKKEEYDYRDCGYCCCEEYDG